MEGGDAKLVAEFGFVLSVLRSVGLSQAEAALVRELDAQFHGLGSQLTDLSPSDDGTPRSTSEPATDAHRCFAEKGSPGCCFHACKQAWGLMPFRC